MDDNNLTRGSRVRDRIWGGTESGTVTGVDADGTVTVQWDGAQFTEDQRSADEVEGIGGSGDPTGRYMVMYDGDRHTIVNVDVDVAEDTDGM